MPKLKLDDDEFRQLCRLIFEKALNDVNGILRPHRQLQDKKQVSMASFETYIANHHPLIHYAASVDMLAMVLYKKAVDDIAFQADILGFLLREIPIKNQRDSCAAAVEALNKTEAKQSSSTSV